MAKAVIIDTNILVLLLVGATDRRYIRKHRRLYPVYNERHFDFVETFLTSASKVICTTHVLTEASNLRLILLSQVGPDMVMAAERAAARGGEKAADGTGAIVDRVPASLP